MARALIPIVALVLLAACGNKSEQKPADKVAPPATPAPAPTPTPTPTPAPAPAAEPTDDEIMAQNLAAMTAVADRMCKCADVACADAVTADMTKYFEDLAAKYPNRPDPDPKPEDVTKLSALGERYGECMTKLKLKTEK